MPALVSGQLDEIRPGVRRLVADNPSYMTGPGTNTYIVGRDRCFVIDPGPADEAHLARILEATQGRVDAVLTTHTHEDHSPGAAQLCERTGAPLYGRRPVHPIAEDDAAFNPARELQDDEVLEVDGLQVRALHTPGHASNHVCFFLPAYGLLLTGDHLMQGSTVVIAPPDGSMKAYLASLERLQAEPVTALAPGHGAVIDDAQQEIAGVIAHRLRREAKVIDKLRIAGEIQEGELLKRVYDDVDPRLLPIARYSLLAHLIKLREDGRAAALGESPHSSWRWTDGGAA